VNPDLTALGIDIGGSRVRAGLVRATGDILARADALVPPDGDPQPLAEVVRDLALRVGVVHPSTAARVGVALPGIFNRRTGVVQRAVNLPKLEGVNVRRLLQDALGAPLLLDTDVSAAGWAQWRRTSPQPRRFIYLTLGTGVGGCVILNGRVLRHTHDGPGHLGFLIVDTSADAPVDGAGVRGSLSALVCGPALQAAEEPDGALPAAVLAHTAVALARGCLQLAHLYAPDVIALGGGVIDHHPELVDGAWQAFARYRSGLTPPDLRIARAPLPGDDAGVIGAALLALRA
jgi:glucokinase